MLCDSGRGMKARPPELTRLAVAINYLLTIATLTCDGVGVAFASGNLILADFADTDARVNGFGSEDRFLYRRLILEDEHLLDSFSSVLFPTEENYKACLILMSIEK
jgi:hypothetical protein